MWPVSPEIRESLPRGVGVGSGVEVGVVVGDEWWLGGIFGGGPVIWYHQFSLSVLGRPITKTHELSTMLSGRERRARTRQAGAT